MRGWIPALLLCVASEAHAHKSIGPVLEELMQAMNAKGLAGIRRLVVLPMNASWREKGVLHRRVIKTPVEAFRVFTISNQVTDEFKKDPRRFRQGKFTCRGQDAEIDFSKGRPGLSLKGGQATISFVSDPCGKDAETVVLTLRRCQAAWCVTSRTSRPVR